ncbi:MAG: ABC transporter ATP-binding protein/permease [Clostridiales bacterium]|nr:ABC transporter ATP-binding protein/permease [Clostridiales bacterium]
MLELENIVKEYYTQDETVTALKGITLRFRKSEFVSVLGPSGCGKTTLLNIIGGLDRYTSGDLAIDGKSTKLYSDKDWDAYRNHSIGFVFQSYNLIPHQTVAENVELALTLAGVTAAERRERAKKALEKVGLGNKLNVKPNQLSGGQMQRVAIARALVNDPEIILADEPTGALDSKTSVQIMELLKEISSERLIIMVTHNPELAEKYSSRIIRLLDGELVSDDKPVPDEELQAEKALLSNQSGEKHDKKHKKAAKKDKTQKTSMSFFTALSLSFKNMMTKKARTILVSFAGSIGIIGIALVLSLSNGFQNYIDTVQRNALSNYPITITKNYADYSSIMSGMNGNDDAGNKGERYPQTDVITVNNSISDLYNQFQRESQENDVKAFKIFLDGENYDKSKITAVQYTYNVRFSVYGKDRITGNEFTCLKSPIEAMVDIFKDQSSNPFATVEVANTYFPVWSEMINSETLIKSQYDLIDGKWIDFGSDDEIMLVVSSYNQIPDYVLTALGLRKQFDISSGGSNDSYGNDESNNATFKTSDFVGLSYTLLTTPFTYTKQSNGYYNQTEDAAELEGLARENGRKVKIAGVIRPKEGVSATSIQGNIVYGYGLTEALMDDMKEAGVVKTQLADRKHNALDGSEFMSANYETVLTKVGYADKNEPATISIYASAFENKDYVEDLIKKYNASVGEEGQIRYTDYMGVMLSSVTDIVNAVSYVLIGFVSVSLIVSSIMIGIITYISVLERIKEIGVLRALGASKRDVSRVFNAETLIIGFAAGIMGICVTMLLDIPISLIIHSLAGISNVAALPWKGGLILIAISMCLTLIAGLIPSRLASKKDPVIALRSE